MDRPFLQGFRRGLGLGLAYAVAESILAYVPSATRLHLLAAELAKMERIDYDHVNKMRPEWIRIFEREIAPK